MIKNLFKSILILSLASTIGITICLYCLTRTTVNGSSMFPTLEDGDVLLVNRFAYDVGEIQRYDIIIFTEEKAETGYYIKRVIGLPGETVKITSDGEIYINDKLLKDVKGYGQISNAGLAADGVTLGEDEYFVLGDNRNNSEDSRFPEIGNIHRSEIVGKALIRYYPFDKFGYIDEYELEE